ncbi:cyclic di-GMP phosphodiesterase response regulator RpfG [bacterium BMS3Abin05]|nr:cyclic di-GMP phosphodiesterase response regulator RpfG [bacterium BMS3Abin05]GBE28852.1 cyclic di-GMP phosphodiesterase response regulator RpfG [bacterium BMS3Bbin03]HDK35658.1 response regulator [Bacteroidota bacterium]HDL78156.1 response regulator [Bacteroidota bacterium]
MPAHKVLFVDDEENILRSLKRIFRKDDIEILTALGGAEGLELAKKRDIAVIVSDQRMPRMSGTEFLHQAKQVSPESIRMVLTGYADVNAAMAAINDGEVFHYITKPWKEEDLKRIIWDAIQKYDLLQENKRLRNLIVKQNSILKRLTEDLEGEVLRKNHELLEKNESLEKLNNELNDSFFETIKAFSSLLEMRDFYVGSHSKRVATASRFIAQRFGLSESEVKRIEMAAILHDVGKMSMPDLILQKVPSQMSKNDLLIYQNHPILGQATLMTIKILENLGQIVRGHHELFNGKGFPDGLKGENIPLGARIISVPNTYDNLIYRRSTYRKSFENAAAKYLKGNRNLVFQGKVVDYFLEYLRYQDEAEKKATEMKIDVADVRGGMVLTRDIYTAKGVMLAAKGERLKQSYINRILQYHKMDPIIEGIYVQS